MERFWGKVDKTEECWLWTAATDKDGYGAFWLDGQTRRAHRVAYEMERGPIPDKLQLDHLCRHPGCVNPAHLEAVTCRENLARGNTNMAKTRCPRGHPYNTQNTYIHPRTGWRSCQICKKARVHQ